ncbi:gliding motility-associated ABC transporter ATP-binding subunit GldA [Neotamlana laminarinivorans]|uniref:Gliding motility-associated ABC transporter ATP-binding subunit GldA n=1 Tax=Neotamlana laminarinivorans TaxID=2883124 RepID=A0A9X1I1Q2_9FLAO|nr:gliding motility-associated ABC transporter ATP-binding subunit GldA [Tamlana laminarinivorans]MCB4798622.1 gliding motility-associated ABC transporter ATP-binding subunit GldA [Tamlana laminarinivorans]
MSIEVKEVTKLYGTQKALNKVSFKVSKPEIVGFLGPNGAGKSTMMKILTTYISANQGEAIVNNHNVALNKQQVQQSVGYLPEHNPLYLDMFIKEYLNFNANIYKVNKKRIAEVIELTCLTPEAHKKIGQLSKGYRQRVGLANALLHDPEVLILDEPTTGLDPNQLVEIRNLIKTIGKTKTVFLSTHIMQEVEAMCERVIIINKGEIVADKKLKDLRNEQEQVVIVEFDYRVEDAFLKRLPKVSHVVNTHDFVYEITFKTTEDMRSHVFDFAHDNELKILQLNQKNANLESLFRDLTA